MQFDCRTLFCSVILILSVFINMIACEHDINQRTNHGTTYYNVTCYRGGMSSAIPKPSQSPTTPHLSPNYPGTAPDGSQDVDDIGVPLTGNEEVDNHLQRRRRSNVDTTHFYDHLNLQMALQKQPNPLGEPPLEYLANYTSTDEDVVDVDSGGGGDDDVDHTNGGNDISVAKASLSANSVGGVEGGSEDVQVFTSECDEILLQTGSVSDKVVSLEIETRGVLVFSSAWASSNLNRVRIWAHKGLNLSDGACGWVPPNLKRLDVSHTPLNKLNLTGCSSALKEVLATGCSLHQVSLCAPAIRSLDVSYNTLSGQGPLVGCPGGVSSLHYLQAAHNHLSMWTSCGWESLRNLNLESNQLIVIELDSCHLLHLQELKVSHNQLQELPKRMPSSLVTADFSHNSLSRTSRMGKFLMELDLSHNSLPGITKGTFRKASNLLQLDMSHNHITAIFGHDFIGLIELRELDLSHNRLQHIRHEAFKPLQRLTSLNINHNKLSQLDARLLASLPLKVQIESHHNSWRCDCHLLASLTHFYRLQCKPHCNGQSLRCVESSIELVAQEFLQQCIEAADHLSARGDNHRPSLLPASDEDKSEEQRENEKAQYSFMAIPAVIVVVFVLIAAIVVRKTYIERRKIRRVCCVCLPAPPPEGSHRNNSDNSLHGGRFSLNGGMGGFQRIGDSRHVPSHQHETDF